MKAAGFLISTLFLLSSRAPAAHDYAIEAIRYGTIPQFSLSGLVVGAPANEKIDIPLMFWLIRGEGRIILLDTGFHRPAWSERFKVTDYVRPDEAVRQAGVDPAQVQDIILSHLHWDHADSVDLFPSATIWLQREEYAYYSGAAWQKGARSRAS